VFINPRKLKSNYVGWVRQKP